jgi:protein-S-isoprenylcysteine O-methyltransferase Ste14
MSALADLTIALVELAEAEGRALRRGVVRAGASVGLIALAFAFALGGLALCLWSAYLYLATLLSPPQAALVTGLLTLVVAGGLLWTALRTNR